MAFDLASVKRLAQAIANAVGQDMPLVLHGGSGIPADQIAKAISMGVSKINVNTEFQVLFAKAIREYIEAGKDLEGKGFDPRQLLAPGKAATVFKPRAAFGAPQTICTGSAKPTLTLQICKWSESG